MYRIALFLAGCVVGYVASGYVEGLLEEDDEQQPSRSRRETEASA